MKEPFAAFGKLVDHLFQVPPWILRRCEIDQRILAESLQIPSKHDSSIGLLSQVKTADSLLTD